MQRYTALQEILSTLRICVSSVYPQNLILAGICNTQYTFYSLHCTANIVKLYNIYCTLYSVQLTLLHCITYTIHCIVYTVQLTLLHCITYTVQLHCIVYSVQCKLYNIQCIYIHCVPYYSVYYCEHRTLCTVNTTIRIPTTTKTPAQVNKNLHHNSKALYIRNLSLVVIAVFCDSHVIATCMIRSRHGKCLEDS